MPDDTYAAAKLAMQPVINTVAHLHGNRALHQNFRVKLPD